MYDLYIQVFQVFQSCPYFKDKMMQTMEMHKLNKLIPLYVNELLEISAGEIQKTISLRHWREYLIMNINTLLV